MRKRRRIAGMAVCIAVAAFVLAISVVSWCVRGHDLRAGTHLSMLSTAYRMYAFEHDGLLPCLDDEPGVLSGDMDSLYPAYLDDLSLLFYPESEEYRLLRDGDAAVGEFFAHSSYVYFGRPVISDKSLLQWAKGYRAAVEEGRRFVCGEEVWPDEHALLMMELPRELPGRWGLHFGFGELPLSPSEVGGLVCYLDGRVEFVKYPGEWPMTKATVDELRRLRGLQSVGASDHDSHTTEDARQSQRGRLSG